MHSVSSLFPLYIFSLTMHNFGALFSFEVPCWNTPICNSIIPSMEQADLNS